MRIRYIEVRLKHTALPSLFCGSDLHGMTESCPPGSPMQPITAIGVDAETTPRGEGSCNEYGPKIDAGDMVRVPLCPNCALTWPGMRPFRGEAPPADSVL